MGKILIVDTQEIIHESLIKIARNLDKTVEVFVTGYACKALDYAKNNQIDAFFLDIQLLDYSGIELAKKIRKIEKYMFTPIVFITAISTRELEAFRQIHCYDYIVKPFSDEEIYRVFRKIIKYYISQKNEEPMLKLERKGSINIINYKDIIYLDLKNRKICITTLNEKIYYTGKTLSQMKALLSDDFIQVHQSFIINKRFINNIKLSKNEICLKGVEEFIPIGRTYKKGVRELLG